jgi:small-conductance mechanosensitive channel
MLSDTISSELSLQKALHNLLLMLLVLTVLIFLIWAVNRLLRVLRLRLLNLAERRLLKLDQNGLQYVGREQLIVLIKNVTAVLRVILTFLLIYASLPFLFSLFPWTEDIAKQLISYALAPVKIIAEAFVLYIPNLLTVLVIYLITRTLVKALKFIAKGIQLERLVIGGFYADWAIPTYNIVRSLLYIFMFIIIFPYLPGSDSKVFQGVSVFLGILISFGSSSAISNVVAGVVLTYMRPFQIGDRVKILDYLGDVTQKTLLVTRLKTVKNEDITIPNSTILNSQVVNYTRFAKNSELILHTTVTLGYDTDWRLIHDLLIKAGKNSMSVVSSPEPFVLQTQLNDFYVSYQLNIYVNSIALPQIYSSLHQNIQDEFNKAGVEIMSPHYSNLRDGNQITIPQEYVPSNYSKPGFKVE